MCLSEVVSDGDCERPRRSLEWPEQHKETGNDPIGKGGLGLARPQRKVQGGLRSVQCALFDRYRGGYVSK